MVSRHPVKYLAKLLLALLLGAMTPAFAGEELVLIASARSSIEQLDSPFVRRLFLGLKVTQHGERLRPLLNESDSRIKEIFLQNVVSMSDSTFDRYFLRLALMQGSTQPRIFHSSTELINSVAVDLTAVTYAWRKDVERDSRVRVLRVLWHD